MTATLTARVFTSFRTAYLRYLLTHAEMDARHAEQQAEVFRKEAERLRVELSRMGAL